MSGENAGGPRLLLAAKEAGAGSLLASFLGQWQVGEGSVVLASSTAAAYFEGLPIQVIEAEHVSEGEIVGMIRSYRPDRVAVGCSVGASIEKLVLVAAQAEGLAVEAYVDHYWNLWQRFADPDTATPWAYRPDEIHVPSEVCRKRLVDFGFPEKKITLFDHPLLNRAAERMPGNMRSDVRRTLGISSDAVVVLFVSEYVFAPDPVWQWDQPHEADFSGLLSVLLSASARQDLRRPLIVLVRPHPGEQPVRWDMQCAAVSGSRWTNAAHLDKRSCFACADLVFGLNSMLLLEAAAAGLPVYSLHLQESPPDSWLSTIRPEVQELADTKAVLSLLESFCQMETFSS